MKKICLYIGLFFPLSVFGNLYTDVTIDNHRVQYITHDIHSEIYDINIGVSDAGSNLREIMGNHGGVTAMNGVFFCPTDYSQCKGKNSTINERFIDGNELSTYKSTGERVVFGWDIQNKPLLYQTDKINTEKRTDIHEGFANFPLLLQSGENMLEHYYDVGLIGNKMRIPITRHFICSDTTGEKIHFGSVQGASLDQEIPILLKIGCFDALNLDAGASSAFIYNGRYIQGPGRDILDGVVISRRGFNSEEIEEKLDPIFVQLEKTYKYKKSKKLAQEELQNYKDIIIRVRKSIYKKYTTQLQDGYQLESTSLLDLKKIYILNRLQEKLSELLKNLN